MNYENQVSEKLMAQQAVLGGGTRAMNPTFRENIEARIQMHKDEIARLEKVKEQRPMLLDVNLRDLREAMQF